MSDFPQYDTLGRLTNHSMIPRRDFFKKFEELGKIFIKIANVLTHWSVIQAGFNDEKNMSIISLEWPLNKIQKSHKTPHSMIPQGDWLSAVWYPREIDSAQYDTPGRLTQHSMVPGGDFEKFE